MPRADPARTLLSSAGLPTATHGCVVRRRSWAGLAKAFPAGFACCLSLGRPRVLDERESEPDTNRGLETEMRRAISYALSGACVGPLVSSVVSQVWLIPGMAARVGVTLPDTGVIAITAIVEGFISITCWRAAVVIRVGSALRVRDRRFDANSSRFMHPLVETLPAFTILAGTAFVALNMMGFLVGGGPVGWGSWEPRNIAAHSTRKPIDSDRESLFSFYMRGAMARLSAARRPADRGYATSASTTVTISARTSISPVAVTGSPDPTRSPVAPSECPESNGSPTKSAYP